MTTRGGRPAIDIPEALVRQLQHSAATGAECVIEITADQPVSTDEIRALKRHIVRARYKLFPDRTVRISVKPAEIRYRVTDRETKNGAKK